MSRFIRLLDAVRILLRRAPGTGLRLVVLSLCVAAADLVCLACLLPLLRAVLAFSVAPEGAPIPLPSLIGGGAGHPSPGLLFFMAVAAFLVKGGLLSLRRMTSSQLQGQLRVEWATCLMRNVLEMDLVRLAESQTGALVDDIVIETRDAAACVIETLEAGAKTIQLAAVTGLLFYVHWPLAVILLGTGGLLCLITRPIWDRWNRSLTERRLEQVHEVKNLVTENILGVRDIRTCAAQSERVGTLEQSLTSLSDLLSRQALMLALPQAFGEAALLLTLGFLLLIVPLLSGTTLASQLPLFGYAILLCRRLLRLLSDVLRHLMTAVGGFPTLQRVQRLLDSAADAVSSGTSPQTSLHLNPARTSESGQECSHGDIVVTDLIFAYPGQPAVLNELSFRIPRGGLTLIVGPSGSGKSTLADLLTGLLTPTSGTIALGSLVLAVMPETQRRQRIGYVSQKPYLFHATIAANLRLGRPELSDTRLTDACRQAGVWDWIASSPAGLETVIGERGLNVSGGEAQRLALARVLARSPDLLLFDEPTTGLDPARAEEFWQLLHSFRGQKTIIAITHHRPQSIQADQILHVASGRVRSEPVALDTTRPESDQTTPYRRTA